MSDLNTIIRRMVIPMVDERSREPGDAWDIASKGLVRITQTDDREFPSLDQIAEAIDPTPFNPPMHWTLGNVAAGKEMARRAAKRVLALFGPRP